MRCVLSVAMLLAVCISGLVPDRVSAGYAVIDVGALSGPQGAAYGINDRGDVVGFGTVYTPNQRSQGLYFDGQTLTARAMGSLVGASGGSYARAINDGGFSVGYSTATPGGSHAFIYDGTSMIDLSAGSPSSSAAYGINNVNQVVGSVGTHAALWNGTTLTDLGTLDGLTTIAFAVNDVEQIVGQSLMSNLVNHAFLYDGQLRDLGTLSGLSQSVASDINNSGQIVGRSYLQRDSRAFLYDNGTMRDIGSLGGSESGAESINDLGQIVGWSRIGPAEAISHGFLYSNSQMVDLNSLLPIGSPWTIVVATGINNRGQIAAIGFRADYEGGASRALRLDPVTSSVPEPASLVIWSLAALGMWAPCNGRFPNCTTRR